MLREILTPYLVFPQGDCSREFLGKKMFAYNQAFRVELLRSKKEGGKEGGGNGEAEELFDLDKLYVSYV